MPDDVPPFASEEAVRALFRKMQSTEMNDWVGSGDAYQIARLNLDIIRRDLRMPDNACILDFGCGIGRKPVALAEAWPRGLVIGIDIMARAIDFCRREIEPVLPNTEFHTLAVSNPLYDPYAPTDEPVDALTPEEFARSNPERFDTIVAHSVFTHFDPAMAADALGLLASVLRRDGQILLTAFLDTPWARPDRRLRPEDDGYRDAQSDTPLNFTIFSFDRFAALAHAAGLRVTRIVLGMRDAGLPPAALPSHAHDLVLLSRIAELPAHFDPARYLKLHPDVAAHGADPVEHYLRHGYYEGRRTA